MIRSFGRINTIEGFLWAPALRLCVLAGSSCGIVCDGVYEAGVVGPRCHSLATAVGSTRHYSHVLDGLGFFAAS